MVRSILSNKAAVQCMAARKGVGRKKKREMKRGKEEDEKRKDGVPIFPPRAHLQSPNFLSVSPTS
jgi:hypothetical protein